MEQQQQHKSNSSNNWRRKQQQTQGDTQHTQSHPTPSSSPDPSPATSSLSAPTRPPIKHRSSNGQYTSQQNTSASTSLQTPECLICCLPISSFTLSSCSHSGQLCSVCALRNYLFIKPKKKLQNQFTMIQQQDEQEQAEGDESNNKQKWSCPFCKQPWSYAVFTREYSVQDPPPITMEEQKQEEKKDVDEKKKTAKISSSSTSSEDPADTAPIIHPNFPPFSSLDLKRWVYDESINVYFETQLMKDKYYMMRSVYCFLCYNIYDIYSPSNPRRPHLTFYLTIKQLEQHLNERHQVYLCSACTATRSIFIHEHSYYTRRELPLHFAQGSKVSIGHTIAGVEATGWIDAHPFCQFCCEPYFSTDELYVHLTTQHRTCRFCQSTGTHKYLRNDVSLRAHFRRHHSLCEHEECKEKAADYAGFRDALALKAHYIAAHVDKSNMSRSEIKRLGNISFDIFTQQQIQMNSGNTGGGGGGGRRKAHAEEDIDEEEFLFRPDGRSLDAPEEVEQFPSLDAGSSSSNRGSRQEQQQMYDASIERRARAANSGISVKTNREKQREQKAKEDAAVSSSSSSTTTNPSTLPPASATTTSGPISGSYAAALPSAAQRVAKGMVDDFPTLAAGLSSSLHATHITSAYSRAPPPVTTDFPSLKEVVKAEKRAKHEEDKEKRQQIKLQQNAKKKERRQKQRLEQEEQAEQEDDDEEEETAAPTSAPSTAAISAPIRTSSSSSAISSLHTQNHVRSNANTSSSSSSSLYARDTRINTNVPLPLPAPCLPAQSSLRNKELIVHVKSALLDNDAAFDKFKLAAGQYRHGDIGAEEFLQLYYSLLGTESNSEALLMELISLLPDEQKRVALHGAYAKNKIWRTVSKIHDTKVQLVSNKHDNDSQVHGIEEFQSKAVRVLARDTDDKQKPNNTKSHDKQDNANSTSKATAQSTASAWNTAASNVPAGQIAAQDNNAIPRSRTSAPPGFAAVIPDNVPPHSLSPTKSNKSKDSASSPTKSNKDSAVPSAAGSPSKNGSANVAATVVSAKPESADEKVDHPPLPSSDNTVQLPESSQFDIHVTTIANLAIADKSKQQFQFLALLFLEVSNEIEARHDKINQPSNRRYMLSADARKHLSNLYSRIRLDRLLEFTKLSNLGLSTNSIQVLSGVVGMYNRYGHDMIIEWMQQAVHGMSSNELFLLVEYLDGVLRIVTQPTHPDMRVALEQYEAMQQRQQIQQQQFGGKELLRSNTSPSSSGNTDQKNSAWSARGGHADLFDTRSYAAGDELQDNAGNSKQKKKGKQQLLFKIG